jgi:hypothetical protein
MDCDRCHQPLIEIDRYGEQLVGASSAIAGGEEGVPLFWTYRKRTFRLCEMAGKLVQFDDATWPVALASTRR